ncbi:MAG: valine--tRNA ligase [Proteobacteria bacterium]|nr:valine--tRNA ligase [Pseudomonadota bacterium]
MTKTSAQSLPSHFDAAAAELKWSGRWEKSGIFRYEPSRGRDKTFVVDTPPPTVSGSLHVGHVFSYAHTDILVRYQRMRGKNIFYPMGWDDNGLPTERRVQNYFHVRVDVDQSYVPGLEIAQVQPKVAKRERPRGVSRPNFIELCEQLTRVDEDAFKTLWRRVGLSVDWTQEYATIDERSRVAAQRSFLECYELGHVYSEQAPTFWDVDFLTAVAQAEIEERPQKGHYHDIAFGVEGSGEVLVVATTRPELLAACVGVTAHPSDARYAGLFGKRAITPLFRVPVPIFSSELADPEKGTGILMVCTFGDATDVTWWRQQRLPLRQILSKDARLLPVEFGTPGWESLEPAEANRLYAQVQGKRIGAARAATVELLRDPANASAKSLGAALQGEPKPIERPVKFFEKGDRPLEFVSTRQWFVRLLDKKDKLLAMGERVQWHPGFMAARYQDWTKGLQLDWCISRQRFFGVPIPVWYPLDSEGQPRFEQPILANADSLPVDPTTDVPPGYQASQRGRPGGFAGETDVFDTWFTSSLTPQLGSHWGIDPERHTRLFPADIRPQSHEIIRTWTFYTIVKALLHEGTPPWHHVVISGWVLDPDRKKMSKSRGNVVTPMQLLEKHGADSVRYWAARARLGTDTAFDEQMLRIGRRLVTKLFNAGKYVLAQTAAEQRIGAEIDRELIANLRGLVSEATGALERFEYAEALAATEKFFWSSFTDTYLELVKGRARGEGGVTEAERGSAVATLRLALNVLLRLFAPVIPFITEEVWSWQFAADHRRPSIHQAAWPTLAELAHVSEPSRPGALALARSVFSAINKRKGELGGSTGRRAARVILAAGPALRSALAPMQTDLCLAARAKDWQWVDRQPATEDGFELVELVLEAPAHDPAAGA